MNQHGFVPQRSTTTSLLNFVSSCARSFDCRLQVGTLYTEAAFDSVNYKLFALKLLHIGFSQLTVSWISSYLENRRYKVKIKNTNSAEFINSSGVPQGSNLGLLLFITFITDSTYCVPPESFLMYTDDVKLYFLPVKSPNDCIILQYIINGVGIWCLKNDLRSRNLLVGENRRTRQFNTWSQHFDFNLSTNAFKENILLIFNIGDTGSREMLGQ